MRSSLVAPRTLRAIALLLCACALAGCGGQHSSSGATDGSSSASNGGQNAAEAPRARLIDADADALAKVIADRGGARVTLVNAWASWCKPCVEEFPELLMVEHAYRDSGVRLVLISADLERAAADSFLIAQGVTIDSYYKTGPDEAFINALDPKWSGALPATMVYDAEGRRRASWEGKKDYIAFEKAVLEAMQPPTHSR